MLYLAWAFSNLAVKMVSHRDLGSPPPWREPRNTEFCFFQVGEITRIAQYFGAKSSEFRRQVAHNQDAERVWPKCCLQSLESHAAVA